MKILIALLFLVVVPSIANANIFEAIKECDVKKVEKFIREGIDLNKKNLIGMTPLHSAAYFGYSNIVDALLHAGARVEIKSSDNQTALEIARIQGRNEAASRIVAFTKFKKSQEQRDLRDQVEKKALEDLLGDLEEELINAEIDWSKILIETNSSKKIEPDKTLTVLLDTNSTQLEDLVAPWAKDVNEQENTFELLDLIFRDDFGGVRSFFESKNYNLNSFERFEDGLERSPLMYAVELGNRDIVRTLISAGADVNLKHPIYGTALEWAEDDLKTFKLLLSLGADLSQTDLSGRPLFLAAAEGDIALIRRLIKSNIDKNSQDDSGNTALHYAVSNGYLTVVKELIDAGADLNVKNYSSESPMMYADKYNKLEIMSALLANGADFSGVPYGRIAQCGNHAEEYDWFEGDPKDRIGFHDLDEEELQEDEKHDGRHDVVHLVEDRYEISKDRCKAIAFDNRDKMAEDVDQKESNFCWAHATAALLEEQLYFAGKNVENVSRTEIAARVYEKKGRYALASNKGGLVQDALQYYLSNGKKVCLQKYGENPYDLGNEFYIEVLHRLYDDYQRSISRGHTNERHKVFRKVFDASASAQVFNFLKSDVDDWSVDGSSVPELNAGALFKIIERSRNADAFVQKVLLFYCDNVERKSFRRPGIELETKIYPVKSTAYDPQRDIGDFRQVEVKPYLRVLDKVKKSGHSFSTSVCYYPLVRNLKLDPSESKLDCGAHAIVGNAIQWNSTTNQCQVYVKNSHGRDRDVPLKSDWYPLESIMAHSMDIIFLKATSR